MQLGANKTGVKIPFLPSCLSVSEQAITTGLLIEILAWMGASGKLYRLYYRSGSQGDDG